MPEGDVERIRAVFLSAKSLPAGERPAYLDQACAGDADLRREVEQLLNGGESFVTLAADPGAAEPSTDAAPSSAWRPSAIQIAGYQVICEISRGGQAVVCEAIQKSTNRKVAVKIMREGPLASPRDRARFDREVQVLAALNHPNIVRVVDRGTTADGSFFLVMDHIGGPPLGDWLAAYYRAHPEGPPPSDPSELLRMFLKICDAVSAAHLRGIVHRDLKPSNIRIDEHGEPIVLDFGLARAGFSSMTDEQTPQPLSITGQFLGSLPWASPEQAEGIPDKIDVRSDVYSLGVILYQMLTGRFPYAVVGTMRDVLNSIITATPPAPSQMLAATEVQHVKHHLRVRNSSSKSLNPTIDAIVLKALTKRREDRYQSAGELARDLGNYLSGRPTLAGGGMPSKRAKAALPAAFAAVAAVVIVGGIALWWAKSRNKGAAAVAPATAGTSAVTTQPAGPASTQSSDTASPTTAPITSTIPPFPTFDGPTGGPMSPTALVARPAAIAGLKSWTIEGRDHRGEIMAVAYSPDGQYLATGGRDCTVRLWDAANHRLVRVFVGHDAPPEHLAWSPDGTSLASAGGRSSLRVWGIPSGRLLMTSVGTDFVNWSPDGHRLAATIDHAFWVYDTSTWQQVGHAHDSPKGGIHCISWLADSVKVAFGTGPSPTEGNLYICNTDTGECVPLGQNRRTAVEQVAVSPDAKRLACRCGSAIEVWDLASLTLVKTRVGGLWMQWSPGSKTLAVDSDDHCDEWDPASGVARRCEVKGGGGSVAWSPDARTLAIAGKQTVQFIQTDNWATRGLLSNEANSIGSTAIAPSGLLIATCVSTAPGESRVRLIRGAGQFVRETRFSPDLSAVKVKFSMDGSTLCSQSSNGLGLIDCGSGNLESLSSEDRGLRAAWRPRSSTLATERGNELMLWDTKGKKILKALKAAGQIVSLAWSSDGDALAVGLTDYKGI